MPTGPDYILKIAGLRSPGQPAEASGDAPMKARPWIAVSWKCCSAYSRVYRNRAGTAYEGRCPRCGSPVRAVVGAGGTDARFFEAG